MTDLIDRLLSAKAKDQNERKTNSNYYESGHRPQAIGLAVPPAMKKLLAKIGWPRMYIDSLEERLDVEGFRLSGEQTANDRLWSWWQANQMDVRSGQAHIEAMIHGRCYITVSAPNPNDPLADKSSPVFRVESPKTMYAEIDPHTDRVTRAIRVYSDPGYPEDDTVAVYLPMGTYGYRRSRGGWVNTWSVEHRLGVVPVIPILNKARVDQTEGASEIREELRSATDAASRLMMNLQAAAELAAIPQRVLFGAKQEEILDQSGGSSWDAYMASILAFEDADGKIAQFAAAELQNFVNGMSQLEKTVAGITGLPPQYLSFSSDNPASADAIRASEDRLVKKSERKCRIFGEAWEDVMRVALLVMDQSIPQEAFRMETIWRDPSTPTFAAMADGVTKLATAQTPDGRPILPVETARAMLRFSDVEQEQMAEYDRNSPRGRLADLYGQAASPPTFSEADAL